MTRFDLNNEDKNFMSEFTHGRNEACHKATSHAIKPICVAERTTTSNKQVLRRSTI